jgi:hypothetical protein
MAHMTSILYVTARFVVVIPILAVALFAGTAQATILTFNNLGIGNFGDIPGTYGDNVSALSDAVGSYGIGNGFTPNITVEYRTLSVGGGSGGTLFNDLDFWSTQYGDLLNVAYPVNPTSTGEISFVPEPGWSVLLNSFDLGGWPRQNKPNQPLLILDEDYNVIASFSPFFVPGQGHATVTPNITRGGTLRIQFGDNWSVGIDNINFDQITSLDYFKCYEVEDGDDIDVIVSLQDQFDLEPKDFLVKEAELFCNPVDKNGEGILDETAHLTCYEIKDEEVEREVLVQNQLDKQFLELVEAELLCVPSEKIAVVEHWPTAADDDDDDDDN